jgi:hypothetical protein
MGLKYDFCSVITGSNAYQHTDYIFDVAVVTSEGVTIEAADFIDAKYLITNLDGGVIVRMGLNEGITVNGSSFRVRVPKEQMLQEGAFIAQFTVTNALGDVLDPIFQQRLYIKKVTL